MKKKYLLVLACICSTVFFKNPVLSQSDFYDPGSIQEVRIYFKESNWDHILDSLKFYYGEEGRLKGNVKINGKTLNNVGVRYKGFSSSDTSYIKNPFNIDLEYNFNSQNYQGYTKLKLSNVIQDPSFIREVLSYEIARKYLPEPKANFANVYVNDVLLGLYTNVEAVDKNFNEKHYGSRNNSFFKGAPQLLEYPLGNNANLFYHGPDTSDYKKYYKLESDNSETSWIDLVRLIDILNNDSASLDTILNIDRTLWMHAFNYALVNLDSYIGYAQNYYLYMDDFGRFNPVIWDLNMSFGSFQEADGISSYSNLNATEAIKRLKILNPLKMLTANMYYKRPLIVNLLQNSTYKRMFLAHMRTILNENFKNNFYLTRGLEIQNIIDNAVINDPNKFYSYEDFHNNLDSNVSFGTDIFPGLKDFMEARMAYLDTFPGFFGAPVISELAYTPDFPSQLDEVRITAKVSGGSEVMLGYRFISDGIFTTIPMFDDGNHHDGNAGDSIYGAAFTFSGNALQYYIYAQNDSAGIFSPERAEYEYHSIQPAVNPGVIVINEFMELNEISIPDQDGEYDSWIELFNTSSERINLKSLFLSDDSTFLAKWAFPDTIIQPKSFIIVWSDNDTMQSGLHSNFNTKNVDGKIFLYSDNSGIIDSTSYNLQRSGKTYGRYPNGTGSFAYMLPTFGKANYVPTTPLSGFIIFPNPAEDKIYAEFPGFDGVLWIEIFDINGREFFSHVFDQKYNTDSGMISLDISALQNGVYILKLVSPENIFTKKFIVYK